MFKIVKKRTLAPGIKEFEVLAPVIAKKRQPGQFIILRIHEEGERIPLTIADSDPNQGTVTIVFQEVGKSTAHLGTLQEGDYILDFVGPLGNPAHLKKLGTVVCIGGGCGTAPVYPIAKGMKEAGNEVISIIGARSQEMVIMENRMKAISHKLHVCTDDGSYGFHGFVSDKLIQLIQNGQKFHQCLAIGPVPMMKVVAAITKEHNIPTIVSLNTIMVDGTGMCGACRVSVGGKTRFVCVDGPEFDGHQVDWDEMSNRMRAYLPQEKESMDMFLQEHQALNQVESCSYGK